MLCRTCIRADACAAVLLLLLVQILSAAIATGFLVWGLKITLSYMDPYKEQRREAKRQSNLLKQRLGRNIELNEFEMVRRLPDSSWYLCIGDGAVRGQQRRPQCEVRLDTTLTAAASTQ